MKLLSIIISLLSYTCQLNAQYKITGIELFSGPGIITAKEKQLNAESGKAIAFDFNFNVHSYKKFRHDLYLNFISAKLKFSETPFLNLSQQCFLYRISYPVYTGKKLKIFGGLQTGFMRQEYVTTSFFGTTGSNTMLVPLFQTVLAEYHKVKKVVIEAEGSVSLLTAISRAGFANDQNRGFQLASMFRNNYTAQSKLSVYRKLGNHFNIGVRYVNYYQQVNYPSKDFSNRMSRSSYNLLFVYQFHQQ